MPNQVSEVILQIRVIVRFDLQTKTVILAIENAQNPLQKVVHQRCLEYVMETGLRHHEQAYGIRSAAIQCSANPAWDVFQALGTIDHASACIRVNASAVQSQRYRRNGDSSEIGKRLLAENRRLVFDPV